MSYRVSAEMLARVARLDSYESFYLGRECDFIAMRRKIAEAAPELIRNERIADLEAIEAGLRLEIEKRDQIIRRLEERRAPTEEIDRELWAVIQQLQALGVME